MTVRVRVTAMQSLTAELGIQVYPRPWEREGGNASREQVIWIKWSIWGIQVWTHHLSVPLKVVCLSLDSCGESGLGGIFNKRGSYIRGKEKNYLIFILLSWGFLMLLRKVGIKKAYGQVFSLLLCRSRTLRIGNMQYITRLPWVVLLLKITKTLTISVLIGGTTLIFAVFVITSYRWKSECLLLSWKPSSFDCTGAAEERNPGRQVTK